MYSVIQQDTKETNIGNVFNKTDLIRLAKLTIAEDDVYVLLTNVTKEIVYNDPRYVLWVNIY